MHASLHAPGGPAAAAAPPRCRAAPPPPPCRAPVRCRCAPSSASPSCSGRRDPPQEQQRRQQAEEGGDSRWLARVRSAGASALLACALALGGVQHPALANEINLQNSPVYDGASVLRQEARDDLASRLRDLERRTGFHVRVFTQYQVDAGSPGAPRPRELWGSLDNQTVVVLVDPSSPNILNVAHVGDDVLRVLRRPFWTELQSRYGNMFYVREQGESSALLGAMGALADCLGREGGCRVVPGLPSDQYFFTLWCSVAGGLVAGSVARIEPQGFVQRRWVWVLLFSPLWGSLFVNFGLGPVVSRTPELWPLGANAAAFLAAAAAPSLLQRLWDGETGGGGSGGGGGGGGAAGPGGPERSAPGSAAQTRDGGGA